jgi:hypothetical protein
LQRTYVATAMPAWESDAPGVAAMQQVAAAAGVPDHRIDEAFYLGYTQAATAHALLEAAAGRGGLSRAVLRAVLEEGFEVDLQMGGDPVVIGGSQAPPQLPRVTVALYRPVSVTERMLGLEPVPVP